MKCQGAYDRAVKAGRSCEGFGVTWPSGQKMVSLPAPALEAEVLRWLVESFRSEGTVERLVKESERRAKRASKMVETVADLEADLAKTEREEARLASSFAKRQLSEKALEAATADLHQRQATIKARLVTLRAEVAATPNLPTVTQLMEMSWQYPLLPDSMSKEDWEGAWATDPKTGVDFEEVPGYFMVLDALAAEAEAVLNGDELEVSREAMEWLGRAAALVELKVLVSRSDDPHRPRVRVRGKAVQGRTFDTCSRTSRASRRSSARWRCCASTAPGPATAGAR